MNTDSKQHHENAQNHLVTVTVNENSVAVMGPKATGLEIKQAAVDAGLQVGLDFVLSEERPNGDVNIIGDSDELTLNPQSRFLLVGPDHNS